jgi:hypothetical protein
MRSPVTLGAWAGFWGDSPQALRQVLDGVQLDYLVSDHLAEVSLALLARARAKNPESAGYIDEAVQILTPVLAELHARGIKVVMNAGALNPAAAARALREAVTAAGLPLKVASVEGDDLSMRVDEFRDRDLRDMFTGEPIPAQVLTCNAYLSAFPIAEALAAGADIVVTGRCPDSAVILGPLIHEFGWQDDDYDLLSAGTLVGHIVECGPQALGGLFTDWESVPGWDDMGYPVAECRADGTAVITKPPGTGGLVVPGSVAEQILYEIGDPGAYLMPDVTCDWRAVRLEQAGPDRVLVSGAKGRAPTSTYKATTTCPDGFRVLSTALLAGRGAAGRARRAGEAMLDRAERIAAQEGLGPFTERSIEVVGAGDAIARPGAFPDAREAVLKVGARHPERRALEIFATEMFSIAFAAQGLTGIHGGRPKPAPAVRLVHLLVDKTEIPVTVTLDDEVLEIDIAPGVARPVRPSVALAETATRPDGDTMTVPLYRLAYARSGDKGNHVNIGVIARRPEFVPVIHGQVTAERVRAWFAPWATGPVTRWALPGLHAINILLEDALGGAGGTSSLRYDPLGKSMAATLLDLPVECPAAWERDRLPAQARSLRSG